MTRELRLLIAEDSEDDALLVVSELELAGYELLYRRVDTAEAMHAALGEGTWDVVISDHSMPRLSSNAAFRILRERDLDIPFIIVSGTMGEDEAVQAMKSGAHDYIMKGNLTRLVPAIERELREAELRRERREMAQRVVESEARYRSLVEQLPAVTYRLTRERPYDLLYVSPQVLTVIGYTEEECLEDPSLYLKIIHPQDFEKVNHFMSIPAREGESLVSEYRVIRRDGQVIWVRDIRRLIENREGEPLVFQGIIIDLTDRKLAEEKLRRSEERMRNLIEAAPVGIQLAVDGRYDSVNQSFLRMFGYDELEEIRGLPVEALYAPDDRHAVRSRIEALTRGETGRHHYQARCIKKDGGLIDIEAWITGIQFEDRLASVAFIIDVTDTMSLRAQLAQAQKMEALGTLAGGVAHDFNNLLTVILGYSDLLLSDQSIPERSRKDLEKVLQAGRNGADLVQRLLALSRKAEIKPRPMILNQQVEQVHKLLSRTIPKMIEMRLKLTEDLTQIYADPTQIEQIIMNLAVNARDAMPQGGVLTFETGNVTLDEAACRRILLDSPGKYVMLSVTDTGSGMDEHIMAHIFEPFFTTKEAGQGTGLGLAMVYGIIKRHGGGILCESRPGQGTKFTIHLPIIEAVEEKSEETPAGRIFRGGNETILVVDDEEHIRELGKRILRRAGYTVLTASDSREALETYRRKGSEVAMVILDLVMPNMGGAQCLDELVKLDPESVIVIASGMAPDPALKESIGKKAKGFVTKPYVAGDLLKQIREVLDKHSRKV